MAGKVNSYHTKIDECSIFVTSTKTTLLILTCNILFLKANFSTPPSCNSSVMTFQILPPSRAAYENEMQTTYTKPSRATKLGMPSSKITHPAVLVGKSWVKITQKRQLMLIIKWLNHVQLHFTSLRISEADHPGLLSFDPDVAACFFPPKNRGSIFKRWPTFFKIKLIIKAHEALAQVPRKVIFNKVAYLHKLERKYNGAARAYLLTLLDPRQLAVNPLTSFSFTNENNYRLLPLIYEEHSQELWPQSQAALFVHKNVSWANYGMQIYGVSTSLMLFRDGLCFSNQSSWQTFQFDQLAPLCWIMMMVGSAAAASFSVSFGRCLVVFVLQNLFSRLKQMTPIFGV